MNNSNDKLDGGTLNIGNGTTSSALNVSKGTITRNEDVLINTNSNLKVSGGDVTLDSTDTWNGHVGVSDGKLTLDEATKSKDGIFS